MNTLKTIGTLSLVIVGIVILSGLSLINRGCTQAHRIVDKTIDADNVIYNYEYFKRQYQEILAYENKVRNAQEEYDSFLNMLPKDNEKWDWNDKSRLNILASNITGVKNVYRSMVAEYNSRANMVNRSIFMGKDVPPQINPIY